LLADACHVDGAALEGEHLKGIEARADVASVEFVERRQRLPVASIRVYATRSD
jgi:hypothetical protein